MNKKLAKQLKDAGFPQECRDYYGWVEAHKSYEMNEGLPEVDCPSLSELIDACGDSFLDLIRYETWGEYKWCASGRSSPTSVIQEKPFDTPEEAVANLWMAINNK